MGEPKQLSNQALELMRTIMPTFHASHRLDVDALLSHVAWLEGENKRLERVIPCAACGVCRGEIGVITTTIADRAVRDRHTAESTRTRLVQAVKDLLPELERTNKIESANGFIGTSYELGQTKEIIELLEAADLKGK